MIQCICNILHTDHVLLKFVLRLSSIFCYSSLVLDLPQLLHYVAFKSLRLSCAGPSIHNLTISSDQELFEIPLDPLQPHDSRFLTLHPFPHGLGRTPIHIRLPQHGEGNAVIHLAELLDGIVVTGILPGKLITREPEDDEVVLVWCRLDLFPQGFETFKLRGEAALRGGVDNEDDFALMLGEGVIAALLVFGGEFVKVGCGGHGLVGARDGSCEDVLRGLEGCVLFEDSRGFAGLSCAPRLTREDWCLC